MKVKLVYQGFLRLILIIATESYREQQKVTGPILIEVLQNSLLTKFVNEFNKKI